MRKYVLTSMVIAYAVLLFSPLFIYAQVKANEKPLDFPADANVASQAKQIAQEVEDAKKSTEIAEQKKREEEERLKREEEERQARAAEEAAKAEEAAREKIASYAPVDPPSGGDGWVTFSSTAYACSPGECSASGRTATGTYPTPWKTVAVDPSVIPLGSTVEIQGVGTFIAEDTGGAIGGYILDVYTGDLAQALQWGRRTIQVRWY